MNVTPGFACNKQLTDCDGCFFTDSNFANIGIRRACGCCTHLVPAPAAKHVVLRQNGAFYGLYVMMENVDDAFLERQGFDPTGPLLKAVHWKYSNLRPAAAAWAPCTFAPDWESKWGPCPEGEDLVRTCTNTVLCSYCAFCSFAASHCGAVAFSMYFLIINLSQPPPTNAPTYPT
jgi:hypothetical protein